MSFSAWLSAPFLKELSGKQLYEVMLAIKDGGITGECECYVENGNAFVLHFIEGQPTADKAKVAEILKRKSIVCAWMPGKTSGSGISKALTTTTDRFAEIRAAIEPLLNNHGLFTSDDRWLILLHQTDIIVSSERSDASGGGLATALVAQINGSFRDITQQKHLQRFSLDFAGTRFGFESVGGAFSVVYRSHQSRQQETKQCTSDIRRILAEHAAKTEAFTMRSVVNERSDAKYCLVRPQIYQKIEADFRKWVETLRVPWDCFWFQYDSDITYAAPRHGEAQQEIGGAFAQLNTLVRQGFERLTGNQARNFVLYADGLTLWCDFFDKGFWATRFSDDKIGFRRSAEEAAHKGWSYAERAFTKK